jgi:hypothetical protein
MKNSCVLFAERTSTCKLKYSRPVVGLPLVHRSF